MSSALAQTWHAFAKINLELRVLGRRPDGYHELRTVLQTVDLTDEIRIRPSEAFRFTTAGGDIPGDGSNLVVRAVKAFEALTDRRVDLHFHLTKRIPWSAGLGGGSSDAAVTLMGLNRYYATEIPGEELYRLAGELGSDVPFFQVGGRAVALGRGEMVFPLDEVPMGPLVLVFPPLRVSTREAYSWLTETPEPNTILGFCAHFVSGLDRTRPRGEARLNDFEGPLFSRFPELGEVKRRLVASGARFAGVSGSGAALFAEFESETLADLAVRAFVNGKGGHAEAMVTRAVGRTEYLRRMFGASGGI